MRMHQLLLALTSLRIDCDHQSAKAWVSAAEVAGEQFAMDSFLRCCRSAGPVLSVLAMQHTSQDTACNMQLSVHGMQHAMRNTQRAAGDATCGAQDATYMYIDATCGAQDATSFGLQPANRAVSHAACPPARPTWCAGGPAGCRVVSCVCTSCCTAARRMARRGVLHGMMRGMLHRMVHGARRAGTGGRRSSRRS